MGESYPWRCERKHKLQHNRSQPGKRNRDWPEQPEEAHGAAADGRNPRHAVRDDMREQQGSWHYNRLETPVKMVGPGATGNVFRRCP